MGYFKLSTIGSLALSQHSVETRGPMGNPAENENPNYNNSMAQIRIEIFSMKIFHLEQKISDPDLPSESQCTFYIMSPSLKSDFMLHSE